MDDITFTWSSSYLLSMPETQSQKRNILRSFVLCLLVYFNPRRLMYDLTHLFTICMLAAG